MPYIHFTEDQKLRANSVDLVEFLRRQGEKLISSGQDKRLTSDHSITHVCLNRQANGLSCGSVILLEQLRTIDKSRLRERVGALDTSEMKQIDWALGVSVGLVEGYR